MLQCFRENAGGWKDLKLSKSVVSGLGRGDLILNLNYDTVFELGLMQLNKPFAYSPNSARVDQLLVCKPHGSLNNVSNDQNFKFGQPDWLGMPQPKGFRSYSGLIPPRLNKRYSQHPIARMILEPVVDRKPDHITMWGVGLTESDVDLIELYGRWSTHVKVVDVINPAREVVEKVRALFPCSVRQFSSVAEWKDAPC
jgi:hypothetical protein